MAKKYKSILTRYEGNPIFDPADFQLCKAEQIFNPGQVLTPEGKTILLLSVVTRNNSGSFCYVAESDNGINFKVRENPLFTNNDPTFPLYGSAPIDCRVTYFPEENCYYIIRPGLCPDNGPVALLYRTKDFETVEPIEVISLPANRVPCLFPEKINGHYVRLDRPYNCNTATYSQSMAHIWLSRSPDLIHWGQHRCILRRGFAGWNGDKIGPTPPIKTEKGWLEIIHGVQNCYSSWRYSLGAVLLDLENPEKVIGTMKSYLLTPEVDYEHMGVIPDTVFTTGGVVDWKTRKLRIYYGASDTYIGLAEGDVDEIIDMCIKEI